MATYVVGARKTVSRDFSFEHSKYKGSVACRSAFFFQNSAFRAGKFYLICLKAVRINYVSIRQVPV